MLYAAGLQSIYNLRSHASSVALLTALKSAHTNASAGASSTLPDAISQPETIPIRHLCGRAVEFVRSVKLALAFVAACPLSNDPVCGKVAFGDAFRKSLGSCGFEHLRRDAWINSRLIDCERVSPGVAVSKARDSSKLRVKRISLTKRWEETARARLSIHVRFVTKMSETGP